MRREVKTTAEMVAAIESGDEPILVGGGRFDLTTTGDRRPKIIVQDGILYVEARGSSQPHVEAWGSSQPHVEAWESSQPHVEARGSSQPHVVARGSSQPHVVARGSSQPHVVAWGS
ncbi:MAG TPA: hypothetical protein VHG72_13835, partial [Polyangia bacterium]|nr:hypothetical protein [Polyangia bacterium]